MKLYSWFAGIWENERNFYNACRLVARFNGIEQEDFCNLVNDISKSISVVEIDDCNVWDLCKYGMKVQATLAYSKNFRKNFNNDVLCLAMAKREVDKIYNIVHKTSDNKD